MSHEKVYLFTVFIYFIVSVVSLLQQFLFKAGGKAHS